MNKVNCFSLFKQLYNKQQAIRSPRQLVWACLQEPYGAGGEQDLTRRDPIALSRGSWAAAGVTY